MDKYIKAIRENICSICVDSSEEGDCTLTKEEICAVEQFFPQILEVVQNTDSEYVEDYYHKLKDVVCKDCKARDEEGRCYLREDANCSLDRYFSLIVETIKKVDAESV
jgi:hypothetical protein